MKALGWFLLGVAFFLMVVHIIVGISCYYNYENSVYCWWSLADKSSTISAKEENIDKFVDALSKTININDHNAMFLKTPNNSGKYNFEALKTLQSRLKEIKNMKVNSFEYQTAIQQITAQEQGEAKEMLKVFDGIYTKTNYPICWDWYGGLFMLVYFTLGTVGTVMICSDDY